MEGAANTNHSQITSEIVIRAVRMGYRLLAYKLNVVLSCTFPAVQDGKSD